MIYNEDIIEVTNLACCGIKEIDGLSRTKYPAEAMYSLLYNCEGFRYIIFSQAGAKAKYGERFANFIYRHKLGSIVSTRGVYKNPNSGNILKAWIWTVDTKACNEWFEEEDAKQEALRNKESDSCYNYTYRWS